MSGSVINVGRDEPISMVDLARLVVEVLGSSSSIDFITYEQAYGHAIEDMIHRRPDVSKLRTGFDFSPRHELVQTIIDIADGLSGSDQDWQS